MHIPCLIIYHKKKETATRGKKFKNFAWHLFHLNFTIFDPKALYNKRRFMVNNRRSKSRIKSGQARNRLEISIGGIAAGVLNMSEGL
jgi:hypothetical protein